MFRKTVMVLLEKVCPSGNHLVSLQIAKKQKREASSASVSTYLHTRSVARLLLFLGLILSCTFVAKGQTTDYLFLGGDTVGVYEGDTLKDNHGHTLLVFEVSGAVKGYDGSTLYTLTPSMQVLDMNGDQIGSVLPTGQVWNSNNDLLGTVTAGSIKDANDDTIGSCLTMPPARVAIFYFFGLEQDDM